MMHNAEQYNTSATEESVSWKQKSAIDQCFNKHLTLDISWK